jgi:hypothetical protein
LFAKVERVEIKVVKRILLGFVRGTQQYPLIKYLGEEVSTNRA